MLYDPKLTLPEIKSDPLSLESLIGWLETMPADQKYDYACSHRCMLGQWLNSIDPNMRLGDGDSYQYIVFGKRRNLRALFHGVASRGEDRFGHTFGAALDRARKALASQRS